MIGAQYAIRFLFISRVSAGIAAAELLISNDQPFRAVANGVVTKKLGSSP